MAAGAASHSFGGMMQTAYRSDAMRDRTGRMDAADRVRWTRPNGPARAMATIRTRSAS
jgi:hypothetical protein